MFRFIRNALIGSSLLLMGMTANAQVYQDRDDYSQQRMNVGNVLDQVRSDLNQAMNMGYLSRSQRSVLAQAREDLGDFDRAWDQGSFNRHELNEAIGRLESVVNSGRMSEDQRAMLQDDIGRLRGIRESQMSGYYGSNNGYYRNNTQQNGYYDRYGNWHPYR